MQKVTQNSRSWQQRNIASFSNGARCVLQRKGFDVFYTRADECDAAAHTLPRKLHVLTQKSVSRMDGLRACRFRGGQNMIDGQITLAGRRGTHQYCFISIEHVTRFTVRFGIHGDRTYLHGLQRAQNAAGDRPAIRHQDPTEHARPISAPARAWGYKRWWPSAENWK